MYSALIIALIAINLQPYFFLIYLFIVCIEAFSSLCSLSATTKINIDTTDWTVMFSFVQ